MKREEAEAVGGIYAASWKAAYRGIVPQAYLDELSGDRWAARLSDSPYRSYVLLENGRYAGTSSLTPARDEDMAGWGEIISLYLLPEYFGKGCGKALMEFDIRTLGEAGFDKLYLWALEENGRARAFYERCGFRHDGGTKVCDIGGKPLREVRYTAIASCAQGYTPNEKWDHSPGRS